jgi:hypothetical protein
MQPAYSAAGEFVDVAQTIDFLSNIATRKQSGENHFLKRFRKIE